MDYAVDGLFIVDYLERRVVVHEAEVLVGSGIIVFVYSMITEGMSHS